MTPVDKIRRQKYRERTSVKAQGLTPDQLEEYRRKRRIYNYRRKCKVAGVVPASMPDNYSYQVERST